MADSLNVCLLGLGLTGREVARVLLDQEHICLKAVICSPHSSKAGQDLGTILSTGPLDIPIYGAEQLEECLEEHNIHAAIDFSCANATISNCRIFKKHRVHVVIGTTGFDEIQTQLLKTMADKTMGIVHAPNITTGINVLMLLTSLAASILDTYDPTIIESHFKRKKDAPSGTAKKIAKEIVKAHCPTKDAPKVDVPILAVRAGGIVGRHEVVLAGEYDRIEIVHESFSRKVFALGALRALEFIQNRTGFYEMQDVLNLETVFERYVRQARPSVASVAVENGGKRTIRYAKQQRT